MLAQSVRSSRLMVGVGSLFGNFCGRGQRVGQLSRLLLASATILVCRNASSAAQLPVITRRAVACVTHQITFVLIYCCLEACQLSRGVNRLYRAVRQQHSGTLSGPFLTCA